MNDTWTLTIQGNSNQANSMLYNCNAVDAHMCCSTKLLTRRQLFCSAQLWQHACPLLQAGHEDLEELLGLRQVMEDMHAHVHDDEARSSCVLLISWGGALQKSVGKG